MQLKKIIQREIDSLGIKGYNYKPKDFEFIDDDTVMYTHGKLTINFEFPNSYPLHPPKVDFWSNGEGNDFSQKINEHLSCVNGTNYILITLDYIQKNKDEYFKQQKLMAQNEENELIENFKKTHRQKYYNIDRYGRKEILRLIETEKGQYLTDSETEYSKRPKKIDKEVKMTQEEKLLFDQKEEAKNTPQAKGTMASFLKEIQINVNTQLPNERKLKIIANIKALCSFLLLIENRDKAVKSRVIVDIANLIKVLGDPQIKWDGYIEEILIYATFTCANLSKDKETHPDLFESRINYTFWELSKRIRGEIRDHINDIMERLDINLNFSMDIFKSFNQKTFSDFKFVCVDETVIYAHKCILEITCGGFDLMEDSFYPPKEVSSFAVFQFIQFLYSPTFYFVSKEDLKRLEKEGIEYFLKYIKVERMLNLFKNLFLGYDHKLDMENLMEDLVYQLFSSVIVQQYSDIEFSCFDSNTEELVILPAHKVILTGRSDYFEKMFALGLLESTQKTIQSEFDLDTTRIVLRYLYSDDPNNAKHLNYKNAIDCLYASDCYMIRTLKLDCQNFIVGMIETDNFETLIDIADEFNCPILLKGIQNFVKEKKIDYHFK